MPNNRGTKLDYDKLIIDYYRNKGMEVHDMHIEAMAMFTLLGLSEVEGIPVDDESFLEALDIVETQRLALIVLLEALLLQQPVSQVSQ